MVKKRNPKKFILPHTDAKLKLYTEYLKRYLRILSVSGYFDKINIFDIFCGTGIYEDGKKGSPVLAFDIIKNLIDELNSKKIKCPIINLIINDGEKTNVEKVKSHLDKINTPKICNVEYFGLDSNEMISNTIKKISKQSSNEKNILFIDPYGYKEIHKDDLLNLLKYKNTEIILFLPISHMHRFKGIALKDFNNKSYEKLRIFLKDFFDSKHNIYLNKNLKIQEFIKYISDAFRFKDKNLELYTTSFYIQRDKSNYNAIFFITPNLLGYERIIDVKWDLDYRKGEGFRLNDKPSLFDKEPFRELEKPITLLFNDGEIKNNIDLYLVTLFCEHPIKHTNDLIKIWKSESKIEVRNIDNNKVNNRGTYLNYKEYKSGKPKVNFKLLK